jgi:hypothetical protein
VPAIKNHTNELSSNFWTAAYFAALFYGLYKTQSIAQPVEFSTGVLFVFAFVLWFRFWWYDNIRPGYKRVYPCYDDPKAWKAFLSGIIVIVLLATVFFFVESPLYFMGALAGLYGVKAVWHISHKGMIRGETLGHPACKNSLKLAAISDAVVGAIFGIYLFIFTSHQLLAPILSFPPLLQADLNSVTVKTAITLFVVGATTALEVHYSICQRIIDDVTSNL